MSPHAKQILPFDEGARAAAKIDSCLMNCVWTKIEGTAQILGTYEALWDALEVA